MLGNRNPLIQSSHWLVRFALWTNRLFLAAVLIGLLLSFLWPAQFAALLIQENPGVDLSATITGLRLLMLLGVAMAVATEFLLSSLAEIIASVSAGDPFIAANARRLLRIGWALLALQLLDIPAALIERFFPSLGNASPGVTFSPGGWIAVLMVFVLSRVFAAGSAMRDDLEGTV